MKTLYKDENLEVIIPESYDDNLKINHNFCTKIEGQYDFFTKRMGQTLYRYVYNDGYIMGLGYNKTAMRGQWVDNMKEEDSNRITSYNMNGDPFDYTKIMEFAKSHNNKNLENLSNKIAALPDGAKNCI